ncbi:hypothetical protein [Lacinutrix salivirga]
MKNLILLYVLFFYTACITSQSYQIDKEKILVDLNDIIHNIESSYVYLEDKKIDVECIKERYTSKINNLKNKEMSFYYLSIY